MSDTAKGWTLVMLWLAIGLATVYVSSRRHPDWYACEECRRAAHSPGAAAIAAIGWPVTLVVTLAAEALPPEVEK